MFQVHSTLLKGKEYSHWGMLQNLLATLLNLVSVAAECSMEASKFFVSVQSE